MRKIAGVIGWPVKHSLSPKLHNYWLNKYGIDGEYLRQEVKPENLAAAVKACVAEGWCGFNLTLPHKELVLPMLDSIDDVAAAIGAVNTVVIKPGGKLHGTNTDAYGFIENIRPAINGKNKAVLLGAGGAAKAVCHALTKEGFVNIVVLNRTPEKAAAFSAQFPRATSVVWEERNSVLCDADLLVNATSLGMAGKEPLDIDLSSLPKHALVTDIVYTPLITPLLAQAKARGNPIVDGLGMLLHQAVPGFKAWFDFDGEPDINDELRNYILGESHV